MPNDAASYGTKLKVGDTGDNGRPIVSVVAAEETHVIYITDDGKAGFDCNHDLMNRNKREIEFFDKVNSKIFNLLSKRQRSFPANQLGYALSTCFIYDDDSGMKLIDQVDRVVRDKLNEAARLNYIIAAIVTFTTIFLIYTFHDQYFGEKYEAATVSTFGALGALISIFHRLTDIETQGNYSNIYISAQAAIRVTIGCAFGFVCFFLINANIIFGILSTNDYGMYICGLVAGWNERLIPEALGDIKT